MPTQEIEPDEVLCRCGDVIAPIDSVGAKDACAECDCCVDCCTCDDDCPLCDGTGIGQLGDPDTSRCGGCGGTGVPKRAREEDDMRGER